MPKVICLKFIAWQQRDELCTHATARELVYAYQSIEPNPRDIAGIQHGQSRDLTHFENGAFAPGVVD